jgi:ABC-type glucose/galactose transport system permease subunit
MALVAPFADIESSIATDTMAMLANVVVTKASGAQFLAEFDAIDRDVFDGIAQVGDYTLRYLLTDATLAVGDVVTINGQAYRVPADPDRVGHEAVARLVEHA